MSEFQTPVVRFYRRLGNWRWSVKAGNREKIGASTEGYRNKADALANFRTLTGRNIVANAYAQLNDSTQHWIVRGL